VDPFGFALFTPGWTGRLDCGDPNHPGRKKKKTRTTKKRKWPPDATPEDLEICKDGDHKLEDEHMNSDAKKVFKALLADLRAKGLPVRVWETYRTPERQKDLYASSRTDEQLRKAGYSPEDIARARRLGNRPDTEWKAGSWKWSPNAGHSGGKAMDVWWVVKGKPQAAAPWKPWLLKFEAAVAAHRCKWGGHWTPVDRPHVEYVGS
jgi:hypothetical protein